MLLPGCLCHCKDMQLRFATNLSAEEYVGQKAWRYAELCSCPLHPEGGCSLARHGTYTRKFPSGIKISRWYCSKGHTTFSLLPDCLSARLPGTLLEVEVLLNKVQDSPSQEAVADKIRDDIELIGALRWVRHRLFLVQMTLNMLIDLVPDLPKNFIPKISCFQQFFDVQFVLPVIRGYVSSHLQILPPPIGFASCPKKKKNRFQHKMGTDPPQKER